MKILLIDNFFYRRGGAEVVFLNTGDLLKAHGHDVVYFSQRWDENVECETATIYMLIRDVKNNSMRRAQ